MRRPLLRVDSLDVHFPVNRGTLLRRRMGEVHAVDGVSFDLLPGETLGLVGESGCGKTTLGKAILRLIRPTGGRVLMDGTDITNLGRGALRDLRRRMQIIFQDPYGSLNPRMTVAEIISEPIRTHDLAASPQAALRAVEEIMNVCGLDPGAAGRYPREFSSGQQQRVAIARALSTRPDLLVCDEPVSALDVSVQAQILHLLRRLIRQRNISCLFISHDLATVQAFADRIAVMYLGRIVEIGPADAIAHWPLHPCTQALVSAIPVPDPEVEAHRQRLVLLDEPPSPISLPTGCRFHTRCPQVRPTLCATQEPVLKRLAMAQHVACHWAKPVGSEG